MKNGIYVLNFNYPRYFITLDASDGNYSSHLVINSYSDSSYVDISGTRYFNGSISMMIQTDASFDIHIRGYDIHTDSIIDMGYLLTADTVSSLDSINGLFVGLNDQYVKDNNFIDFVNQPYDYTLEGNDDFYTVSAELVYDGIKTHISEGDIIYDAHYNIEMAEGHSAATHNIVITENSSQWRLSSNNAGTFIINSSGVFSASTTTRTYSDWLSRQPYFMHIGPVGNVQSSVFQRDSLPKFNENYNIDWFSTNGPTDVFSHRFAFSHDYPLTETSFLYPIHYIWNGNNHIIQKLSFMTFFSASSRNEVTTSSSRHYTWNEKMNDITFQYDTDIYLYTLQFASYETNSKNGIPILIKSDRFVSHLGQDIIDFSEDFSSENYTYDQNVIYGIEKGLMFQINTPNTYSINDIEISGNNLDISFEYVDTNKVVFKINDVSDSTILYVNDSSTSNKFNTFGKLLCQNANLLTVDVSTNYDIVFDSSVEKVFHYYEDMSGSEIIDIIPYELSDVNDISNNTIFKKTTFILEGKKTYHINNVPSWYPLSIETNSYTGLISVSGDSTKKVVETIDGVSYDFYYGNVEIEVSQNYNYTESSYNVVLFSSFNGGTSVSDIYVDSSGIDSSSNESNGGATGYTNIEIDTTDNIVITFDINNINVSYDLSLSLFDICDNYSGVIPSTSTLSNIKYWDHLFYFKASSATNSESSFDDISFAVDYSNLPYFNYSEFTLSGDDVNEKFSSNPEVKYQLLVNIIEEKFGSTYALNFINNKASLLDKIKQTDVSMNQLLINSIKNTFGIFDDLSYNCNQTNISKTVMKKIFSIIHQSNDRKTSFESYMESYLNRIGEHNDVWIPLKFEASDKLVFTYSYNISNLNYSKKYMFCLDLYEDPSNNSYVYSDLSTNTSMDISNGFLCFNNDYSDPSIKRYHVKMTTYTINDISQNYPIAFLNHGKEEYITYNGDESKQEIHTVYGDNIAYKFYYGTITLTITKEFDTLSVVSFHDGNIESMGGINKLFYKEA